MRPKKCECCKNSGKYSILLCQADERFYIPNQYSREYAKKHVKDYVKKYWFCHKCMREIEDNFRATINKQKKMPNRLTVFLRRLWK